MVGGLLVGTILSLFDIPIMHTYVDDFIRWLHRTFMNSEWHWPVTERPGEGAPPHDGHPDEPRIHPAGAE